MALARWVRERVNKWKGVTCEERARLNLDERARFGLPRC